MYHKFPSISHEFHSFDAVFTLSFHLFSGWNHQDLPRKSRHVPPVDPPRVASARPPTAALAPCAPPGARAVHGEFEESWGYPSWRVDGFHGKSHEIP